MYDRKAYVEHSKELENRMFKHCVVPTVYDFAEIVENNSVKKKNKLKKLTEYIGNTDDILESIKRVDQDYSQQESTEFIKSVIAANITDITQSGYFYKKLISSCDDMQITGKDCKSKGVEITLPVSEDEFDYKIKNHWVNELNDFVEDFNDLPKDGTIHIRNFLTCKQDKNHRCFCEKCAGIFRREYDSSFTPKYIGVYSTYMITEHATQASLDSMNKGESKSINVLLEQKITDEINNYKDACKIINNIIDDIGNVGVDSRFYEIALLSRLRDNKFSALSTSFLKQEDVFGAFIYKPTKKNLDNLLASGTFKADSVKTKIALDEYL